MSIRLLSPAAPQLSESRRIRAYQATVRRHFSFLKETARLDDLLTRSIALPGGIGYLAPVCALHSEDERLLETLARWRNENVFAYPSQFQATVESTRSWLRDRVLAAPDRMLFLVLQKHGRLIGHMGLANALDDQARLEMDNIVRGVKGRDPGLMAAAMDALLDWTQEMLAPEQIYLRVLDDNAHAIAFYEKLGFALDRLLPLRRHEQEDGVFYRTPAESDRDFPDRHFLRMVYAPQRPFRGEDLLLTAGPSISAQEVSYVVDAARNGWNHEWNKYLTRFEQAFAEYLGVRYALATSSCTGALHLALLALGIGPGDEVIVPDLTWVATANAVAYAGATPVFADVEPDSWCLDAESLRGKITSRTKAVIPVHLYGHPAHMDAILPVAAAHGLRVIEDAAPAVGAEYQGQRCGSFGDFSCFSFQGAKLLVTGEGGMLLTNDDALYERAGKLWDQGRVPGSFWINELGWKYKMSNLQAALGLGQLERVEALIEAKRRIFRWYEEGLDGVPYIRFQREVSGTRSIYWMTSIVLEDGAPLARDALRARLRQHNIDTRPTFPAISRYPHWSRRQEPQPVANGIGERGINLPSGVGLRREQVDYVCACLREELC
jgi:perosamine synthetase